MSKKKLKQSSDYPQFYFRVSEDEKKLIDEKIETILFKELNKWELGTTKPKRNEIIIKAILKGLSLLEKER